MSSLALISSGPALALDKANKPSRRRSECLHCGGKRTHQSFNLHDHFSLPHYLWRCDECDRIVEQGDLIIQKVKRMPRVLDVVRKPRSL